VYTIFAQATSSSSVVALLHMMIINLYRFAERPQQSRTTQPELRAARNIRADSQSAQ